MSLVNTLIKWPGGKSREIKYIENLIPTFDRYLEPFFGGGAMFFYLKPQSALVNDISVNLIDFYTLVKEQDRVFKELLNDYFVLFDGIIRFCEKTIDEISVIYYNIKSGIDNDAKVKLTLYVEKLFGSLCSHSIESLKIDEVQFKKHLFDNALDKMLRTVKNEQKAPFCDSDLKENLITGFTSGTYMYFRKVYNDILLGIDHDSSKEYRIANFYFIREYCYGSMFRYNSKGEFNIPYGGMSYNRKNFKSKIDDIFNSDTERLFEKTDFYCSDFADFLDNVNPTENDFMFLDPPYDTDFSEYEGNAFTQEDQKRLAAALIKTKAKFILIIKNTDFIYSLYEPFFNILFFDKTYSYNVRSRNNRNVEHLIITNIPV